ncbi:MAG: aprataxin-like protein [Bogoriella megaspora]|nr:MAG: aprataxin-like protein [Bogoriella megaspora]
MAEAPKEESEDAITAEEMAAPATADLELKKNTGKANAFTELMSRKPKPSSALATKSAKITKPNFGKVPGGHDRNGLSAYTTNPTSFPPNVVIFHDDSWVVIHDMFPKAIVHLLILPRSPSISNLHPVEALADPSFLASAREQATKWRSFAASELRRRFGSTSASESARREAMNADDPPEELPQGRDWEREIKVGIHVHPSMNHLHIHVLSREMHSERMKHRKHYNSFNTPFFVPLEEFPLSEEDERSKSGEQGYLRRELKCWRCGRGFGMQFARLKEHLEEEFDAWKRE